MRPSVGPEKLSGRVRIAVIRGGKVVGSQGLGEKCWVLLAFVFCVF